MTLATLARRTGLAINRQSPTILAVTGSVGVLATAYFSGRAGFRVGITEGRRVRTEELENRNYDSLLDPKELIKEYWKEYIPTASIVAATLGCIIVGNVVSVRRQSALLGAYTLTEQTLNRFKDKAVETIGEKKVAEINDEIAKDEFEKNPPPMDLFGHRESIVFDHFTGQYFLSDMESLRKAQNDINEQCINGLGYATLNDFYARIGANTTADLGEQFGWTTDNMLELQFTTMFTEGDKPAIAIGYKSLPKVDYHRVF